MEYDQFLSLMEALRKSRNVLLYAFRVLTPLKSRTYSCKFVQSNRKYKKQRGAQSAAKTAEKILSAQLREAAVKRAQQ